MLKQWEETQELVNQAIMKQREETQIELRAYAEQQCIENDQYKLSMQ